MSVVTHPYKKKVKSPEYRLETLPPSFDREGNQHSSSTRLRAKTAIYILFAIPTVVLHEYLFFVHQIGLLRFRRKCSKKWILKWRQNVNKLDTHFCLEIITVESV